MDARRSILAALCATTVMAAQSHRVVPAGHEDMDANVAVGFPFAYDEVRAQQVFDARAVASRATLTDVAWRAELEAAPYAAFVMRGATLELSHTSVASTTMQAAFASNVTSAPTVVFQGDINVAAQPPVPGLVMPWSTVVVFASPFAFDASLGNLLVDLRTPKSGNPVQRTSYFVDGVIRGGNRTPFGASGVAGLELGVRGGATGAATGLVPGGLFEIYATALQSLPGALNLGSSASSYLGIPLPADLTPFGAPGNWLYTGPDLGSMALTFTQPSPGIFSAVQAFQVPASASVVGATLVTQALLLSATANPLGLLTSNGLACRVGAASPPPTRLLGSSDPTRATGVFHFVSLGPGGAVVRLGGTFQ